MKHYCDEWIKDWCEQNGWTDLVIERYHYWAFPPGAVMPEPIPVETLRTIKAQKGFSFQEKLWIIAAAIITPMSVILSYYLQCPMPLVFAFAFGAITVAKLEIDE